MRDVTLKSQIGDSLCDEPVVQLLRIVDLVPPRISTDVKVTPDDVRDGLISIDAARREYGVVIDPTNLRVDETRTTALRASRGSA